MAEVTATPKEQAITGLISIAEAMETEMNKEIDALASTDPLTEEIKDLMRDTAAHWARVHKLAEE